MGDCHLDDLLDLLDQDDEFEENAIEETRNQNNGNIDNSMENTTEVTDHEKEALKKKLKEMEEQMKIIKSQLVTDQTSGKTVTEVDLFASNSEVENRHLKSPVKVRRVIKTSFLIHMAFLVISATCHGLFNPNL